MNRSGVFLEKGQHVPESRNVPLLAVGERIDRRNLLKVDLQLEYYVLDLLEFEYVRLLETGGQFIFRHSRVDSVDAAELLVELLYSDGQFVQPGPHVILDGLTGGDQALRHCNMSILQDFLNSDWLHSSSHHCPHSRFLSYNNIDVT